MGTSRHRYPPEQEAIETADEMLQRPSNRTVSPSVDAMEAAAGPSPGGEALEGQMGPDEISDPDELIKNNEAKLHQ